MQATTKEGLDAVKAQLKGYSKGMEVNIRIPVHGRSDMTSSTGGAFSCMPHDPGLCKMTYTRNGKHCSKFDLADV